jgi:alpha-glucosidase
MAMVDEKSMNALGQRTDGSSRPELLLRIFPSPRATSFTCYEDDGETIDYQKGIYAETLVTQQIKGRTVQVTIGGTAGNYQPVGARNNVVELVYGSPARGVEINGKALKEYKDAGDFDRAGEGYINLPGNRIKCKTGVQDIKPGKSLIFQF